MPKLRARKQTLYVVDWIDLRLYLSELWGFEDFEILESDNDVSHKFDNIGSSNSPWTDFKDEYYKAQEEGGIEYYFLGDLLQGLYEEKHIPAGTYIIDVSW